MKKIGIPLLIGLVLGAGVMYLVLSPKAPVAAVKPAGRTSFAQVTGKLDPGGDLYAYFNAERMMAKAESFLAKLGKLVQADDSMTAESRAKVEKSFAIVSRFFVDLGFPEINGLGVSSVETEPGLYHSKFVLGRRPGKGEGLIWRLSGTGSQELAELKLLPSNTVLANFGEFQAGFLWSWVKAELEKTGMKDELAGIAKGEADLLKEGISVDKILGSLTGRMGYLATLDDQKKVTFPIDDEALEIPEPAMALVVGVKDGSIFELLSQKMTFAQASEADGWKKLQIPVPGMMPFTVEPLIAWKNDLLVVASNTALFQSLLDTRASGNGLTAGPEFKKYSARLPERGTGFQYVGSRLFRTVHDLLKKAASRKAAPAESAAVMGLLDEFFSKEMAAYAVRQFGDDGMVIQANHSFNPALLFIIMSAASQAASQAAVNNEFRPIIE